MATKTWSAGVSGTWGNGLYWSPSGLPASTDDAVINGPAVGYDNINGNGVTASMSFIGGTQLSGAFATSALAIGTPASAGSLTLASGSLAALNANIVFGPLQVTGAGTKLTVTGQLSLGGPRNSSALTANSLVVASGGGAQLGTVLMQLTPGGNGITVADSLSYVEIGTIGGAAKGRITVDADRAVTGVGSLIAPGGIVNQGTITAQGGTLAIGGGVTGAGKLQIGASATLFMMNGSSAQGVTFTGAGGTLELTLNTSNGLTETGPISGFVPGDLIWFASGATVTGVIYKAGGAGTGTLTLNSGAVTVGTLLITGDYTGYAFQATANAAYGTNIAAVKVGSGGTASGGSPGTDSFAWIASGGSWGSAANWQDTTTLVNGVAAPGSANAVTIAGPTGSSSQIITGPGQAGSLLLTGNTTFSGSFGAGSVTVGQRNGAAQLGLGWGSTLAAGSVNVTVGGITASGTGTRLTVAGALTLSAASAGASSSAAQTLTLNSGAAAQVGSLALNASLGGNSVSVDSISSLEVGTAGGAGLGRITVDAGQSLSGSGLLLAASGVVNNGTITARGGALQIGSDVTGTGQLAIGAGATLYVYGGVSAEPVTFAGAGGTLQMTLTGSGALTESGPITGFTAGDTIYLASSTTVTSVSYAGGKLTLNNGGVVLGTLALSGNYIGYGFSVGAHGSYGTDVTVTPKFTSPDPLFDPVFYLQTYPDVAASGMDPYQHYMNFGWKEGRDPNAYFHTTYYLNQNPDIAAAGINPLTHYEQNGWREGRDPSIAFSTSGYLAANPDVKAAGMDPLQHYLQYGKAEGRAAVKATPHAVGAADPAVDYAYYYAQHPDVAASGMDASQHYHQYGWKLGYNPDAFFDSNYYLTQNPDVKATGLDPLWHYENFGWKEGRVPSLTFDGNTYLNANPDLKGSGLDPLVHYLVWGQNEGRTGVLSGATTAADPLVDVAYLGKELGATLLPTGTAGQSELTALFNSGLWQRGLNPDAWFDTSYYLAHNPDVAASGQNPLTQYETVGWKQGRDPSAQFSVSKYLAAYSDVRGMDPLLHYIIAGQAEGRTAFHV